MKHHFAHLNRIDVAVGQQVSKGQVIGLMGKTGTTSAHLHYEVQKVFRTYTSYTKGLSRQQVLDYYESPYNYDWKSIAPFSHLGWDWLSDIGGGQLHPGLDINSGTGDTDLNTPIKSPVSGKVIYAKDDTASGWGKHIFIEEGESMSYKVWANGEDIRFNDEQAKEIIRELQKREPDNYHLRGWDLLHETYQKNNEIMSAKDSKISELNGQINTMNQIIGALNDDVKKCRDVVDGIQFSLDEQIKKNKELQTKLDDCKKDDFTITELIIKIWHKIKEL